MKKSEYILLIKALELTLPFKAITHCFPEGSIPLVLRILSKRPSRQAAIHFVDSVGAIAEIVPYARPVPACNQSR
jgi:hypothetical protein